MGRTSSHTNDRHQAGHSERRDRSTHADASEPTRLRDARGRRGNTPVTDGPYAESKEMFGGLRVGRRVFAEEL
jgi:hypothetical protein